MNRVFPERLMPRSMPQRTPERPRGRHPASGDGPADSDASSDYCSVMFGSPLALSPLADAGARAAARRAAVVGLAHAVAQRPLAPVVGVQRLLDVVRAEDRRDACGSARSTRCLVDRAGALPGRDALLLEQADRVLAQPAAVERRLRAP